MEFKPADPTQQPFVSYGPTPIPNSRDTAVEEFIDRTRLAGPQAVSVALSEISDRGRSVLRAYAERMASLAVRRRDGKLLVRAVIANVLGGLDENAPEALMKMPLIENSAHLLAVDLSQIFEEVSGVVGRQGTINLMLWLTRAPEDRTLECMGFVEAADDGGFRYRLNW